MTSGFLRETLVVCFSVSGLVSSQRRPRGNLRAHKDLELVQVYTIYTRLKPARSRDATMGT